MRRFDLKFLRALDEADFDLRNLNVKIKAKAFLLDEAQANEARK